MSANVPRSAAIDAPPTPQNPKNLNNPKNPRNHENPTNPENQTSGTPGTPGTSGTGSDGFKDRFLSEIKSAKATFYNLVVASAYRIDASSGGVTFAFLPNQKNAKAQCEEQKPWLQSLAEKVAGKPVPINIAVADVTGAPSSASASARELPGELRRDMPKPSAEDVKAEAMANATVQAVLEIFPVEKTTVEER